MTPDDFALMAAIFSATFFFTTFLGWRMRNARGDVVLMGGTGAVFGGMAAVLYAI